MLLFAGADQFKVINRVLASIWALKFWTSDGSGINTDTFCSADRWSIIKSLFLSLTSECIADIIKSYFKFTVFEVNKYDVKDPSRNRWVYSSIGLVSLLF